MSTRPQPPHGPGCMCSSCHLSSKLFPRGPNDRIILPALRPGEPTPKSPYMGGSSDRARYAPPRPQSTAPHEYHPRQDYHNAPPMPMPAPMSPRYGAPPPPSGHSSGSSSRRSLDQHAAPPPQHHPAPRHGGHGHHRSLSTFTPPERPASAMATRSPAMAPAPHHPPPPQQQQQQQGQGQQQPGQQGNLEWMPPAPQVGEEEGAREPLHRAVAVPGDELPAVRPRGRHDQAELSSPSHLSTSAQRTNEP
ncbi:hypothetical protein C8R46DRAFT_1281070 [Mycena filopes]|nr:hypothetical protein C8R46DRAFT_1281070 [Mycena filopes]